MHSMRLLLSVEVVKDLHESQRRILVILSQLFRVRCAEMSSHEFVKRSEYYSGESLCAPYSADHVCPSYVRLHFHI